MAEKQTNKQRLKEITDSIEANIQELFQSEKYADYLRTMSRFHKYSFNNTMLIHMQKPDATLVAGYNKWEQKWGRHVKRGEKGIKIIAPTPFKKKIEQEKLDPDTKLPMRDRDGNIIMEEKDVTIPMFKPVVVFDVSQTEGEPLPTLASELKGDVKHYEIFMEALRRSSPVPMEIKPIPDDMDGYFSYDNQSITLRDGMSEVQTISAAVHEITHAKLHNIKGKLELDDTEEYEEIELFDKPALFSNGRVDREKLPEGLYAYDLRGIDDDPGAPVTVEERVAVNHAGAVILAEPLDFGEDDYLALGEEMNFLGGETTLKKFYEQSHPEKVKKDRNTEEVEAESVSFAVCSYYGIETGDNSFGYIASWSKSMELKELRSSLEIINRTADGLISDIDRNFTEICKERGVELEGEQVGTPILPGESVTGGGETLEKEPDEQFFKVNEGQYLYIQRSDGGYDYTLYDAASKQAMDGGQLDAPGLSISAAAREVCKLHEVLVDEMSVVSDTLPEAFTDAVPPPPRDTHEELVEHFLKEGEKLWDTTLDEYPLPDSGMEPSELEQYGIYDQEFLPISKEMAAEMIERDLTVYAVTYEGTVMAFDREEVEAYQDGTLFAIPREEWEQTVDFRDAVADRMNRQQERETAFLNHAGNCFAIYQVRTDDNSLRDRRFMSMDHLQKKGLQPSRESYELAYTAPMPENGNLDTLWQKFNTEQPADYLRPSMSVSDIVAIKKDGVVSCHYVDSIGFQELPNFLQPENYLKSAEMQMEDDYNMVDGVINNGPASSRAAHPSLPAEAESSLAPPLLLSPQGHTTLRGPQPTVAELEEQVKSGQSISLLDLAQTVQREKEDRRKAPPEKDSILAKLRRPLPPREEKKKAPEKSAEKGYSR